MRITFLGAAREVTGSMHLIEVNGRRVLLECGLYQGRRADTYERNLNFPFDAASIDAVVLSHAHIDHSGNIPNLAQDGFRGNIWCTAATRNLCTYMLMDSGHIQEQDVEYVNKKRIANGEAPIEPLYTQRDVQACLNQFIGIGYNRPVTVADGVEVTFFTAGHILGAASVQIDITERATGKQWRLVFSGDIGRPQSPILQPPQVFQDADIVIMECTYGDRLHEDYADARKKLRDVVNETMRKRGKVIIPAFAVGRTQELVYALNQLDANGDIGSVKVFVDSPLAVNATDVFRMHPEAWNDSRAGVPLVRRSQESLRLRRSGVCARRAAQQAAQPHGRAGDHLERQRHGRKRAHPAPSQEQYRGSTQHRAAGQLYGREHVGAQAGGRREERAHLWRSATTCAPRSRSSTATAPTPTSRSCWRGRIRWTASGCNSSSWSMASPRRARHLCPCWATGLCQRHVPGKGAVV